MGVINEIKGISKLGIVRKVQNAGMAARQLAEGGLGGSKLLSRMAVAGVVTGGLNAGRSYYNGDDPMRGFVRGAAAGAIGYAGYRAGSNLMKMRSMAAEAGIGLGHAARGMRGAAITGLKAEANAMMRSRYGTEAWNAFGRGLMRDNYLTARRVKFPGYTSMNEMARRVMGGGSSGIYAAHPMVATPRGASISASAFERMAARMSS